jgi:hypothetical protein
MAAPSATTPSSTASANAALVGRFGRMVSMLASRLPIGRRQSIAPQGRIAQRLQVTPVAIRPGGDHRPRQPLVGRSVAACRPPPLGTHCSGGSEGTVAADDGVRLGPVRLSCPGGGRAGCAEPAGPHALGQPASPSSSKQSGHGRWVGTRAGGDGRRRRYRPKVRQARGRAAWINRAKRTTRRGRTTPPRGHTAPDAPNPGQPSIKRQAIPLSSPDLNRATHPEATPGSA